MNLHKKEVHTQVRKVWGGGMGKIRIQFGQRGI